MQNIFKIIYDLEILLLNPEVRKSADELSTLLADDFTEFGSSGKVYYKPDTLALLTTNTDTVEFLISNFSLKILTENIILATYRAQKTTNGSNVITSLRSSIWRKSDIGEWQMFFHQGTVIHD